MQLLCTTSNVLEAQGNRTLLLVSTKSAGHENKSSQTREDTVIISAGRCGVPDIADQHRGNEDQLVLVPGLKLPNSEPPCLVPWELFTRCPWQQGHA